MPFKLRRRQVNVAMTEREYAYVRIFAERAQKYPAGWVYMILRERLLEEVRAEQKGKAAADTQATASRAAWQKPDTDGSRKPVPSQALTSSS